MGNESCAGEPAEMTLVEMRLVLDELRRRLERVQRILEGLDQWQA